MQLNVFTTHFMVTKYYGLFSKTNVMLKYRYIDFILIENGKPSFLFTCYKYLTSESIFLKKA